jgi:PadR family transcriptional regulator PadR
MASAAKLSHTAAMILHAVDVGNRYGLSIMEIAGLPSGTVYPALRRLERDRLVSSHWESDKVAEKDGRPPRKYYRITGEGSESLALARQRYPHLSNLFLNRESPT